MKSKKERVAAAKATKTTRQRVIEELRREPDGISKNELTKRVGAERGMMRGLLNTLALQGEIEIEQVRLPHGMTHVCRIADNVTRGTE